MNFNDGKVHSLNDIGKDNLKTAAKDFAEGSKELENCLIKLWDLGLNTTACCKGTSEKNHNPGDLLKQPYVSIDISRLNEKQRKIIIQLINQISTSSFSKKPNIVLRKYRDNDCNDVLVLERICLINKSCDEMFKSLHSILDEISTNVKSTSSTIQNLENPIKTFFGGELCHPSISSITWKIKNGNLQTLVLTNNSSEKSKLKTESAKALNSFLEDKLYYPKSRHSENE